MKRTNCRLPFLLVGFCLLPSCTAHYQQLLHEKDNKIKDLYSQVAELNATNQDLESRGSRASNASVSATPATSLAEALQNELPGVDVRVSRNRLSLGINNTVTFNSGSAQLKDSAGTVLQNVARVLKRDFPARRIVVEGHTDTDPINRTKDRFRSNRHLSLERADAVATYLTKTCGVDESSVVVAGYGQFQPMGVGAGKDQNRRVEIVIGGVY